MKQWKKTAALSALLVTVSAVPALAQSEIIPILAPISAPAEDAPASVIRITGPVTYVDLEGGFYAVDGWRLNGPDDYSQYLGKTVVVTGTEFTGMSIYMVKAINVESIEPVDSPLQWDVPATAPVPDAVWVHGEPVGLGEKPVVVDGVLMLPLRPIAEAAGGVVTWDGELQQVHVRLPGRTALFWIGQQEAELNEDGVMYLVRNMIKMAQPAQLIGGRTMIPADALSTVLGLTQVKAEEGVMSLVTGPVVDLTQPMPAPGPAPEQAASDRLVGKITQVEEGRILVEGPAMSNGEPMLIWLRLNDSTVITVGEAAGTLADLTVGAEVIVELSGPIMESYPAQGGAASILVVPAPKAEVITGVIKEYKDGRILLEGPAMSSGEPLLVWLAVSEKTPITVGDAAGTLADLTVGARVEATVSGPMLMSYPAQGAADAIKVLP